MVSRILRMALFGSSLLAQVDPNDPSEKRFRALVDKERREEAFTAAEAEFYRSYYERRTAAYVERNPPRESTGLIPLPELGPGRHKGEEGGLYPGGRNVPPRHHLDAGLRLSKSIQPLDAAGKPSPTGTIVLMSLGMSNTSLEFDTFQRLVRAETGINPRLVLVNGSQGGQDATKTSNPAANYWGFVEQRLQLAGVTPSQVQVVWLKQAMVGPKPPFPADARQMQKHLQAIVQIAAQRYPSLKLAYLSSRIYAGYARIPLSPESHAYETGFAVKWLIADQIAGKSELNFLASGGELRAPWLAWGPYLWADGTRPRGDGLTYLRSDMAPDDGTHPSRGAREKVARLLLEFFRRDPTAKSWFLE